MIESPEKKMEIYGRAYGDLKEDDAAHRTNLTLAIGILLGQNFPGAAASIAVAFSKLYPEQASKHLPAPLIPQE